MSEKEVLRRIIIACIVLILTSIVTSLTPWSIPGPENWLVGWTTWIGSVVVIVVGARVFWVGTNTLHMLLTKGLPCRGTGDNEAAK